MDSIRIKIDSDLKKRMESYKHINWNEFIGQVITEKIHHNQKMNLARAVLINEKIRKKAPDHYDSTEIIRKFRDGQQ